MALDKATLKDALEAIFTFEATQTTNPQDSRTRIAQGIADAIDSYVKGADGIYQGGTLIAGSNPVTSTGAGPAIKLD
jgi:hypothetical protein